MNKDYILNQHWSLWFHSIKDTSWDETSYTKLIDIQNIFDLKYIIDSLKKENFHNSMFFVMKKGIFPNWEDKKNINGSCLSLKIPKNYIQTTWDTLLIRLITNSIFFDTYKQQYLNGISITPKKEFNIVKFWFEKNIKNLKGIQENKPYIQNKNYLYKKNKL